MSTGDEKNDVTGGTIQALSQGPLGIISMFILLVYGISSLVASITTLSLEQKTLMIWFIILFPVFVFSAFIYLIIFHSEKLYPPSQYKDEKNFLVALNTEKLSVATYLGMAKAKADANISPSGQVLSESVQRIVQTVEDADIKSWNGHTALRNTILWVDDRPENNIYERQSFEAIGIKFAISLNTADALHQLRSRQFSAVISDMGRKEGAREGYALLDAMRKNGDKTPLFFYASSNSADHKQETLNHGGQGCTNDPAELYELVISALLKP